MWSEIEGKGDKWLLQIVDRCWRCCSCWSKQKRCSSLGACQKACVALQNPAIHVKCVSSSIPLLSYKMIATTWLVVSKQILKSPLWGREALLYGLCFMGWLHRSCVQQLPGLGISKGCPGSPGVSITQRWRDWSSRSLLHQPVLQGPPLDFD